jgi:hypothetical protein
MGVALEWEPWNWDLWNRLLEPDEDKGSLEVKRWRLGGALEAGDEDDKNLAEKLRAPNS